MYLFYRPALISRARKCLPPTWAFLILTFFFNVASISRYVCRRDNSEKASHFHRNTAIIIYSFAEPFDFVCGITGGFCGAPLEEEKRHSSRPPSLWEVGDHVTLRSFNGGVQPFFIHDLCGDWKYLCRALITVRGVAFFLGYTPSHTSLPASIELGKQCWYFRTGTILFLMLLVVLPGILFIAIYIKKFSNKKVIIWKQPTSIDT